MLLAVTVGFDAMQCCVRRGVQELTAAVAPALVVLDITPDCLVAFVETTSATIRDFGIQPVQGRGRHRDG